MSETLSVELFPTECGTNITINLSPAVLQRLQEDGMWTERIDEGQVSGDGPEIAKIVLNVSEDAA